MRNSLPIGARLLGRGFPKPQEERFLIFKEHLLFLTGFGTCTGDQGLDSPGAPVLAVGRG